MSIKKNINAVLCVCVCVMHSVCFNDNESHLESDQLLEIIKSLYYAFVQFEEYCVLFPFYKNNSPLGNIIFFFFFLYKLGHKSLSPFFIF